MHKYLPQNGITVWWPKQIFSNTDMMIQYRRYNSQNIWAYKRGNRPIHMLLFLYPKDWYLNMLLLFREFPKLFNQWARFSLLRKPIEGTLKPLGTTLLCQGTCAWSSYFPVLSKSVAHDSTPLLATDIYGRGIIHPRTRNFPRVNNPRSNFYSLTVHSRKFMLYNAPYFSIKKYKYRGISYLSK